MAEQTSFDVLIIGGGQAGIPLAHDLATAGLRVALAERKHLGGSCVNFGCTPTKAAIASARVAELARRASEFGLRVPRVEVDFPAVLKRAQEIVLESRNGLDRGFASASGPTLVRGHARLAGRSGSGFRVSVGDRMVEARQVVLNTGTRSRIPRIEGLEKIHVLHSGNWLDRPELPEHLAIVGGGYIGIEMSQFYRRMGSRVTVLVRSDRILGREDPDVIDALHALLEAEGIEFRFNTSVTAVEKAAAGASSSRRGTLATAVAEAPTGGVGSSGGDSRLMLSLQGPGGASRLEVSHLFIAIGRTYNTGDLGLESVGVKVLDGGIVAADERLATNVEGIWVAGDIRGGPAFTHTSWDDYRVLKSQMVGDKSRTTNRVVPYAVFTDPELGRVGVTESQAREQGRNIRVAKFEMKRNGKAREIGETAGFIKVVVDADSGLILGAAILGAEAAELVHLYIDVMNAGAPYGVIRDAVHIHPTLAEAVQSAVATLG